MSSKYMTSLCNQPEIVQEPDIQASEAQIGSEKEMIDWSCWHSKIQ